MPTGVIDRIYPNEGRRKPLGFQLSSGETIRTFDPNIIAREAAGEFPKGSRIEYTMFTNNKGYENIGSISVAKNGGGPVVSAPQVTTGADMGDVVDLLTAIADILAEIRDSLFDGFDSTRRMAPQTPEVAPPPTGVQTDIMQARRQLVNILGPDMAAAQIAVHEKRAKTEDDLLERLTDLLHAHGG